MQLRRCGLAEERPLGSRLERRLRIQCQLRCVGHDLAIAKLAVTRLMNEHTVVRDHFRHGHAPARPRHFPQTLPCARTEWQRGLPAYLVAALSAEEWQDQTSARMYSSTSCVN